MSTIIERAQEVAEGLHSSAFVRRAFVHGATFATTITPEQVESGARVIYETVIGPEWDQLADALREYYRNLARAAIRAMGFRIEGES